MCLMAAILQPSDASVLSVGSFRAQPSNAETPSPRLAETPNLMLLFSVEWAASWADHKMSARAAAAAVAPLRCSDGAGQTVPGHLRLR